MALGHRRRLDGRAANAKATGRALGLRSARQPDREWLAMTRGPRNQTFVAT
jgi:hypothetical protein